MAGIMSQLGFNFSTEKLGDALDPQNDLDKNLKKAPSPYKKWQFDAVANNDIDGYFQNPVLNVSSEIWNYANTIRSTSATVSLTTIQNAADNISSNIQLFILHTNNVSGVTTSTSQQYPDFNTAMGIGEYIMQLSNRYDGTSNSTPILGSMTSLFVEDDLQGYLTSMKSYKKTIDNSISISYPPPDFLPEYTSNLTAGQITTITNELSNCNSLLYTRYTHDWNFFRNSISLMNKFNQVSKFSNMSKIGLHMVENYVGTKKLKSKL